MLQALAQSDAALLLILALAGGVPDNTVATASVRPAPMVERCRVVRTPPPARPREICVTVKSPQRLQVAGLR